MVIWGGGGGGGGRISPKNELLKRFIAVLNLLF